ncbi:MAG: C_GCAxxG_C_C family protein [Promethearchaeota archaeon]|nr:MAG: C_GCAxxG_C_C family protein [Candidatus Lokiarchaeota archaeon]
MEMKKDEILSKAYELGRKYERKCTGCAQTSIAAIFEALNVWNEDVFRAASGLADGLGLTGDGSCGALVGASMVIGYLYGRGKEDFSDVYKPMKSYGLVKKLHDEYIEQFGSCRCYDVQKKLIGRTYNLWDPEELKEAFQSGMVDHCSDLVGKVARMAVKIILDNGFNVK